MQIDKNTLRDLKSWMVSGIDAIAAYAEALEDEYQRLQSEYEDMRSFNFEKVSQLAVAQERIRQLEAVIAAREQAAQTENKPDTAVSEKETLPGKDTPASAETPPQPAEITGAQGSNEEPASAADEAPASGEDAREPAVNREKSAPAVHTANANRPGNEEEQD